jgi:hypothetical protein
MRYESLRVRTTVILSRRNRGGGRVGWERWRTAKDLRTKNPFHVEARRRGEESAEKRE